MAPRLKAAAKPKAKGKVKKSTRPPLVYVKGAMQTKVVKKITSKHFATAPRGSTSQVVYLATARSYDTTKATGEWFSLNGLKGCMDIEVVGVFASADLAEKRLRELFPGQWIDHKEKLEDRIQDDENGTWTNEIILDIEAFEVSGSERAVGKSQRRLQKVWIAKCIHTAEVTGEVLDLMAESKIMGVFGSLYGSRGANAYVTGAAFYDLDFEHDYMHTDWTDGISHDSENAASLELEDLGCGQPSYATLISLECLDFQ